VTFKIQFFNSSFPECALYSLRLSLNSLDLKKRCFYKKTSLCVALDGPSRTILLEAKTWLRIHAIGFYCTVCL